MKIGIRLQQLKAMVCRPQLLLAGWLGAYAATCVCACSHGIAGAVAALAPRRRAWWPASLPTGSRTRNRRSSTPSGAAPWNRFCSPTSRRSTRVLFLGTLGAVALWEHVAPRRRLTASMQVRWAGNFGLLLINSALLWLIYPGFGIGAAIIASGQDWGLLRLVEMPYWLEFLVSIVLLDLGHFGIHYLFHRVPVLWRMHRLHHTDHDFDCDDGASLPSGRGVCWNTAPTLRSS